MGRVTREPTGPLDVDEGIRLGVRVTPAFSTPSGVWAVARQQATYAHRWRHVTQPLRRPVHVAALWVAQRRPARVCQLDHYRDHRTMSREIFSVIRISLSPISGLCSIIIHSVMVCYSPRGYRRNHPAHATLAGIVNLLSGLSRAHLVCHTRPMSTPPTNRYKNHRFPVEIISHAVWLYFRFCLSYRSVSSWGSST
jgi:hypothetical protein